MTDTYLTFYFVGCGASFLYISGNVVINTEFTERRSVAMGIASAGISVGNIVLPFFTSWCIDKYSWRGAFTLLSGLCLQGTIAGFLFYTTYEPRGLDHNKMKDIGTSEGKPQPKYSEISVKWLLKNRQSKDLTDKW